MKSAQAFDPEAVKLAARYGGVAQAEFDTLRGVEFDAIGSDFIAQTKPANFKLSQAFRDQAKRTIEACAATGRYAIFHFNGPPESAVLDKLAEYADRYGVKVAIDLLPF